MRECLAPARKNPQYYHPQYYRLDRSFFIGAPAHSYARITFSHSGVTMIFVGMSAITTICSSR
jgi:hypothetical protein